ncbi:MAG: hypothetical protein RLZ81_1, partial [Pseudomonadota bacterium]
RAEQPAVTDRPQRTHVRRPNPAHRGSDCDYGLHGGLGRRLLGCQSHRRSSACCDGRRRLCVRRHSKRHPQRRPHRRLHRLGLLRRRLVLQSRRMGQQRWQTHHHRPHRQNRRPWRGRRRQQRTPRRQLRQRLRQRRLLGTGRTADGKPRQQPRPSRRQRHRRRNSVTAEWREVCQWRGHGGDGVGV